ncbi:MAG TPA: peptide deformylase [Tepidisphaeraceae bacterium]|jgi:peptide deformylase
MYESLKIIFYPDPRLRSTARPVTKFDADLKALTTRMLELMREEEGVGLAAPQVGINLRLFVMNATGRPEDDLVVCNPVLTDAQGNEAGEEGCLSLPQIRASIDRALSLKLAAQDLQGNTFERQGEGFEARVWQHEFDHLNGIMLIDRMGFTAKMGFRKRLKEMEADFAGVKVTDVKAK